MKQTFLILTFIILLAVNISAQTEEAEKIDELEEYTCDDFLIRSQNFFGKLNESPDSKAYVLVYEGKYKRTIYKKGKPASVKYILPQKGELKTRISVMERRSKYLSDKIIFIYGGFRETHKVEFWIVPPGAKLPTPQTTLKKMKYRKGSSVAFCYDF